MMTEKNPDVTLTILNRWFAFLFHKNKSTCKSVLQEISTNKMGIRSWASKPFAAYIVNQQKKWAQNPEASQRAIMNDMVSEAKHTAFGIDHGLAEVGNYEAFKRAVPVRDYEGLKPYIERIKTGESDILWPGKPAYFAKTSGTTSGTKYIPITKASIPNHINSARNALLSYVHTSGRSDFLDHKLIFLSGSPVLTDTGGIKTGRLSGMVNHHVPDYLRTNQLPSYETNCIDDWEAKVDRIVEETIDQDMGLISGIPPWVQMYFDKLTQKSGKAIKDLFPDFSLFVYGGVNFEPYRKKLFESIGKPIDSIETYPSSEGFIAYQDDYREQGLLLLANSGIFYEFIPADQYFDEEPDRLSIDDIEIGINYAVVINSNAGLWGYAIGDTVKFISKYPHRLLVTGRIKHFISAFGEHVIGEEVEKAMQNAIAHYPETKITEFTVAPQVTPNEGLPMHEWFIEFENEPGDIEGFADALDLALRKLNTYYDDLITGSILQRLSIISIERSGFVNYMKSIGKLGGQNKVPRLSNDRKIANQLMHRKR